MAERNARPPPSIPADCAEGLLRAAQGNILEATWLLGEAASLEQKHREAHHYTNDPPSDPWPAMRPDFSPSKWSSNAAPSRSPLCSAERLSD